MNNDNSLSNRGTPMSGNLGHEYKRQNNIINERYHLHEGLNKKAVDIMSDVCNSHED